MTGYTVHTGTSEKFTEGWDRVFGGTIKPGKKKAAPKKAQKTATAAKKAAKVPQAKKKVKGK